MENNTECFLVTTDLEVHPVASLLPMIEGAEYEEFKEDICGNGLIDPIILFQGKILDGRNRYNACKELNIDITARTWEGGMDAVEYVVSKNIQRRHLTPSQRSMAAAKAINYHAEEAKKRQQEHGKTAPGKGKSLSATLPEVLNAGKAADKVGKLFKVSGRTVSDASLVQKYGTQEEIKAVEKGKTGVSTTAKTIRTREKNKPSEKPTFNLTNDNVEWARWTWNPVTGCKMGCKYCYARDIGMRFNGNFDPKFYPDRLACPTNTTIPKGKEDEVGMKDVFVCSMADLFGDWVPQEWIDKVIEVVRNNPQWNFIFLTKNPTRLVDIKWPDNSWVGTTVDSKSRVKSATESFQKIKAKVKFLSCEPLKEDLGFTDLAMFNWIIIGGQSASTGEPAFQPEWKWVENLHQAARKAGCAIYWKPNLTVRPKEYPGRG